MKLALVGTGLIGGAFALAARDANLFDVIVGIDAAPANAQRALALGIVDQIADTVPADADAVLLAVPTSSLGPWVEQLAEHAGIVMDVGSVKGALVDAMASTPSPRFVPCHPIAGLERSGPDAARGDLFQGQRVVVTPLPGTNSQAVATVEQWWQAVGAYTERMDPWQHDVTFATTSHLPHLVAFAYMQQVTNEQLQYAAGGFRDFSRIAAADPDMWTAILDMNRSAVTQALDLLQHNLADLQQAIASGDQARLRRFIEQSQRQRQAFDDPATRH